MNSTILNTLAFASISSLSTDIVLESLIGVEQFKRMKANTTDADAQQRILACKWLYVQGFLNNAFPATESFTPAHIAENDDGDDNAANSD